MKTISRYIMTLALLLTAVTGAWAQSYEAKVFDVPASWTSDETNLSAADLPKDFVQITKEEAKALAVPDGNVLLIYGFEGVNVKVLIFMSGTLVDEDEAPEVRSMFRMYQTDSNVKVCYTAPAGPKVAWNASTKTGTFEMPASDVVLTPIYSAATIYSGETETPFETLKEAFANVKNGDVITLDWNVTLTEALATPSTASDISFTLDFNGFVIDNTGGTNYIMIDNGCELTLTDNSTAQTGGLKTQFPIAGSNGGKVIFQGGRYSFSGCSSQEIASEWDGLVSTYGWVMGDGKEFVDLNNGQPDDDGFMVRVDWKAIELTIGAGRFATFYSDQNTTLADGTDANIGLYTIDGEGINLANNTVTVTKVNDPIAIAGMPLLVYNGTTEQKTVTLKVTPVAPTAGQMWSEHFQGTAVDKTFTADDMAAADYYALSGGKAFAPVKGAGTLGANQCWLQFDKQEIPSARQFTLVFDSEATGIKTTDCTDYTDSVWYDLNGRKVAAPSKKGIYIMNGRKVVK